MSIDEQVTQDLIETLEDGREGFATGADKLADSNSPDLAETFRTFSRQRAQFSEELKAMADTYGDDMDSSGSAVAALHRGWMSLKDALAGSDPDGVLAAAEQGEDHALKEFDKALESDVSVALRTVVERQRREVAAARDHIAALRNTSG